MTTSKREHKFRYSPSTTQLFSSLLAIVTHSVVIAFQWMAEGQEIVTHEIVSSL